jgi:hypothetical protein
MITVYIIISILGFVPLAIVLFRIQNVRRMKKSGIRTYAVVTQVPGGNLRSLNSVTIEYIVPEKRTIYRRSISVAGVPYKVGDKLPMYYDKNNPEKMLLDSGKVFIFMVIFTLLIAIFGIVVCFLINNSIAKGEI